MFKITSNTTYAITSDTITANGLPYTLTLSDTQWLMAKQIIILANHDGDPLNKRLVPAIKLLRTATGLGLRDAKMAIEAAAEEWKDDRPIMTFDPANVYYEDFKDND